MWRKSMTWICGEELSLDILGKNFKKHITEHPRHLKYLRKLWKKKERQRNQPPRWGEKGFGDTNVGCVENRKNI